MPRNYQLSEATAAQRRFPVYLVDATDGITAETGEASGQPQISKNGAAFANTSATLTAIGNGAYYVELTAAELNTLGIIQVRFKSAATAEFSMDGAVVSYDPFDAVRMGLTALPNADADAALGLPISDAGGLDLDTQLAETNEITAARMGALTDWIEAGRLDAILDIIAADVVNIDGQAMRGTDSAALASECTAARLSELDAGTGGKMANQVDVIETDTTSLNDTKIPQTLNLTASGNIGIDWANVENPSTAQDLAATDIQLCDTVTVNTDVRGTDGVDTATMRGTDSAALASVLGAIDDVASDGDPTAVDTLVQYIKQLINILAGSAGVVTYPAEQAPANGINLAEVLAAIHADVTGLAGSAMIGTNSAALASECTAARLSELDAGTGGKMANQVDVIEADTTSLNDTKIPQTLNLTASGNIGIDWANVENPTTALDLSGTDIQLCDTVTTNTDVRGTDSAALASVCTEVRLATLTDWIDGGRLDLLLDAIQTDLDNGTDGLGALKTLIDAIKTETALIVADTNELQVDWLDGGRLDLLLDRLITEMDTATTEPAQGAPGVSVKRGEKIDWLYKVLRNKKEQIAATWSLYNDAGTVVDSKAATSDDATTATKEEIVTGP